MYYRYKYVVTDKHGSWLKETNSLKIAESFFNKSDVARFIYCRKQTDSTVSVLKEKKKPVLDIHEEIALDTFLSCYPSGKCFTDILTCISIGDLEKKNKDDDDIVIWEPFEDYHPTALVEAIETLSKRIYKKYGSKW